MGGKLRTGEYVLLFLFGWVWALKSFVRGCLKGWRRKRLLVVDDNQAAREILADHLKSLRFTVDTAESGAEALKRVEEADEAHQPWQSGLYGLADASA